MVDCKISFDIGQFNPNEITSLMDSIHTDFIKDILFTSSVLIERGVTIIRVDDIDKHLHTMHTNREELKDRFFHYINFNNDKRLIYSVLNLLNTEDSWDLDNRIQNDTQLILGNKTLKNLCKFIIQYIFKVDLHIKILTTCTKVNEQKWVGWFNYNTFPLYSCLLFIVVVMVSVFTVITTLENL